MDARKLEDERTVIHTGRVWILSVAATVYSPNASANAKNAENITEPEILGMITRRRVPHVLLPKLADASYIVAKGIDERAAFNDRYVNGSAKMT